MTGFFEVISVSSPHIYHSALPLSPKTSIVLELFKSHAHPFARIVHGLPTTWEPSIAIKTFATQIFAAAWSPCSKFIAVLWDGDSDSPVIEVLDAVTLMQQTILRFPGSELGAKHWITFSPEGHLLTWFGGNHEGSSPEKIVTWDIQTGIVISVISPDQWNIPSDPLVDWEVLLELSSVTYSICGAMFGVLFCWNSEFIICTYNALSGTHIYSHPVEGQVLGSIRTHGECLQFATVTPRSIIVWEVGFASTQAPTEVETSPIPDGFYIPDGFLFHPTLPQFALMKGGSFFVWDTHDSKFLLEPPTEIELFGQMTFSPDGRFFACGQTFLGNESQSIYIWKESQTGYIPHQKFISPAEVRIPLISPDGESIIAFGGLTIQLWHTMDSSISLSAALYENCWDSTDLRDFLLEFSPNHELAAVMQERDETITVLDLKSGIPWLVIDMGIWVYGLRVTGSSIVAVSYENIFTWNLPTGDHIPNPRLDITNSVQTIPYDCEWFGENRKAVLVSPDLHYIIIHDYSRKRNQAYLHVYDLSIGQNIGSMPIDRYVTSGFTPDGCGVWYGRNLNEMVCQRLFDDYEPNITELEHPQTIYQSWRYPWESPHGYKIVDGQWILNSSGKRLFWLPSHWRRYGTQWRSMKWGGRFLALLHGELPEVVILEFE